MPRLWMFGHDLDLDQAQPVTVGGLSFHSTLNAAQTSLRLTFDGTCDIATFTALCYVLPVTVVADRVILPDGPITAVGGSVTIQFGVAKTYASPIARRLEAPAGLGLLTTDALGLDAARSLRDSAFDLVTSWYAGTWQRSILRFEAGPAGSDIVDIRAFEGGDVGLSIDDRFMRDATPSGMAIQLRVHQWLPFNRLCSNAGSLTVEFNPSDTVQAILLHPDILDSRALDKGDRNALLYQFGLTNGLLAANVARTTSTWRTDDHRFQGCNGGKAQLVALTLRDEQGHPLVFEADQFALTQRLGNSFAKNAAGHQGWSQTNSAMVLGQPGGWTKTASLRAADPIVLYARPRTVPRRDDVGFINERPYWIESGCVPLLVGAPKNLHGFARNVALKWKGDHLPGPIECDIVVEQVLNDVGDHWYSRTSLHLASGNHDLEALYVDQAVFAAPETNGVPVPPRRRTARGLAGKLLKLPLVDTNWSLSNLAGLPTSGGWSAVGDGRLAQAGARWISDANTALREAFEDPHSLGHIHVQGHRCDPPHVTLVDVIAAPPATTRLDGVLSPAASAVREPLVQTWRAKDTKALGPADFRTEPQTTKFLFGGDTATRIQDRAQKEQANAAQMAGPANAFLRRWCGLDAPAGVDSDLWTRSLRLLRDILSGGVSPIEWVEDELQVELAAERVLLRVQAFATGLGQMEMSPEFGFDLIAARVADMTVEDFVVFWNEAIDPDSDGTFDRTLIDLFLSPPNLQTIRRAAATWANKRIQESAPELLACIRDHLLPKTFLDAVLAVLPPSGALDGFLAQAAEGLDSHFVVASELWRNEFKNFHTKFGPELTQDVYSALLDTPEGDQLLRRLQELGHPLVKLSDLLSDPPDYLLVTRGFRRDARDMAGDDTSNLHPTEAAGSGAWNGRFDLCRLGGAAWHFFLDDTSTIVVKLGGKRGIRQILAEAQAAYQTEDRPNPFGLPFEATAKKSGLDQFLEDLTEDVMSPDWRGVLVIAPSLDLNSDPTLQTLCGFSYLQMLWAAVGGKAPNFADGAQPNLEVSGHVRRHETPSGKVRDEDQPHDVTWSLVTFDARVQGTTIESGEIAFQLQLKELLGAVSSKHEADWKNLEVRATLPPSPPGNAGRARPFSFAASFTRAQEFVIDIAFLDKLALRSIKVGSNKGDVTLDIDADLFLKDFPSLDFPSTGGLQLRDFRIRLPELPPGESLVMGAMRALRFDLPAVNFPLVRPRQVSLFGIEITPTGLGLLRGDKIAIDEQIHKRANWVLEADLPNGQLTFPYVEVKVDFGNLPVFGGGSRLQLNGLLGVAVEDGVATNAPGFALSGARGRDIEFDLFRLLSLSIEELDIGKFDRWSPGGQVPDGEVGVLRAKNWDLRILKWAFLSRYRKDILLAHDNMDANKKGLFAMGTRRPDPDGGDDGDNGEEDKGFFRLDWMLLTRNLDIGGDVQNSLLNRSGANAGNIETELNVIDQVFVTPKAGDKPYLKADFSNGEWLFGIRFRLGELFEYCTMVLHDGHFYGIGLKAEWLEPLTGMEELTFAYIPGDSPELDRFRTSFKIAALNLFCDMRSGLIALEWSPNWDFLVDLGFPWHTPNGYDWFRAFSIPVGCYEAKFGLYFEKRTLIGGVKGELPEGTYLIVGAGFGFYLGYFFGGDYGIAWVRAGIGVFGIMSGRITLALAEGGGALAALKSSIYEIQIIGAIGIFAYGEGGVEVWILSARFRVSAQASVAIAVTYRPGQTVYLEWSTELRAAYSASVRVGSGWFSWTFRVSGSCGIDVHGRTALG
jgi:hypothetical protein